MNPSKIDRAISAARHIARFGMLVYREVRREEPRRVSEILSKLESVESLDDLDRAIEKASKL